ncbi:MAG: hypothetical protein WC264_02905 [Candidatus Paceibacterota bacterium]|jgi:hypothetical protein
MRLARKVLVLLNNLKINKMMTTKLITSKDPKGLHAVSLFESAYNKLGLTDEQAQMLNEKGGEFKEKIQKIIRELTVKNQYANEVINSNYTYPKEYKGPKLIIEQVKTIAELFGLDPKEALEFIKTLPAIPDGTEGWLAVPKVSAVAKKHFPAITDPAMQYCEAVKMVHAKLAKSRRFTNYRDGEIVPNKLRQSARTLDFLEQFIEAKQPGDIIIIAVQYGMRHRGESVRRAREIFSFNEFGLGAFAIGCMALVHPERYVRWEELDTDCAGDEFSPGGDGVFSKAPVFCFDDGELRFFTHDVSVASVGYGSASGFVPQG